MQETCNQEASAMSTRIIYVAADDSKDSVSFAVQPAESSVCTEVKTLPNEPRKLRRFLDTVARQGELRICYEANGAGFALQRQISSWGYHCDVAAPSLTPRRPGDRRKNDPRDARKLVGLHRAGELTLVHIPREAEERVRDLVRCRETLQREVLKSRHYILKLLSRYGFVFRDGTNWTQRFWGWLRKVRLPGEAQLALEEYVALLEYKLARREELDRRIEALAFSDTFQAPVGRVRCLRGFDTQAAMVLITETGDFRRFGSPGELMSYYGLVPSEDSSGSRERRGSITKTGNARCRHVVVQAAWSYRHRPALGAALRKRQAGQPADVVAHAWKAQHRLYKRFHRLKARKHPNVAVTAVARELVGFLWAVMQDPEAVPSIGS
jgi:transposase